MENRENQKPNIPRHGFFRDFFDDISGVMFAPRDTLRRISLEKKILQGLIVLILSDLLPSLTAIPARLSGFSMRYYGRHMLPFFPGAPDIPGLEGIYPALSRMMPYFIAFSIAASILIRPLWHFIFTSIIELSCQFFKRRVPMILNAAGPNTGDSTTGEGFVENPLSENPAAREKNGADDPSAGCAGETGSAMVVQMPVNTGPGLFAAMAFSTLPYIFMAPVNLVSRLSGVNLSLPFRLVFGVWAVVLQIISVRETHGFSTGRAALAYFAPLLIVIAVAIFMTVLMLSFLMPFMPRMF